MKKYRFLLFALILGNTINAIGKPLDFELSDGEKFVRLTDFSPAITLINFWRSDCPPCRREMPLLAQFAHNSQVRVVVIALQSPAEILTAPIEVQKAIRPPVISLNGPRDPSGLLARFGNQLGALPYTVILDSRKNICARQVGEIDTVWLKTALAACAKQE